MIATLKISRLGALFAAVFMIADVAFAPVSEAGPSQNGMRQGTYQTAKPPVTPVAAKLKTPGRGARKQCEGKTTTECCAGLSFCGCLYMPGSDDTHPTSCFSNPPPAPKG